MGPDLTHSLTPRGFADLTDVTLADEDINSIPTNDVNRAILGIVAMQCNARNIARGITDPGY